MHYPESLADFDKQCGVKHLSLGGNREKEEVYLKKRVLLKLLKRRCGIPVFLSFIFHFFMSSVCLVFSFFCVQHYLNNDSTRLSPDNHSSFPECVQMTGSSEDALTKLQLPTHFSFPYQIWYFTQPTRPTFTIGGANCVEGHPDTWAEWLTFTTPFAVFERSPRTASLCMYPTRTKAYSETVIVYLTKVQPGKSV